MGRSQVHREGDLHGSPPKDLIDDATRDEIIDLYDKRNAVIHRFFLNGMTWVSSSVR